MNDSTQASQEPLNIGVVCLSSVGGSGVVACDVASAMARRGHKSHVVSDRRPDRLDEQAPGVRFHGFAAGEARNPAARFGGGTSPEPYLVPLAETLATVAIEQRLDLVHVHYAMPHGISTWLAQRTLERLGKPLPVVLTLHGTDVTAVGRNPFQRAALRFIVGAADAVTTPSKWLAQEAQRKLGVGGDAQVIGNFVDPAIFAPSPRSGQLRQGRSKGALARLFRDSGQPLGDDEPVLMHVSNFRPVKRTPLLARIFEQLTASSKARLVLIGDGPDRSETLNYLRDHGLCDRVLWFGKRRHFAELLADVDAFVMPSESESFGLAALEALSCGVPVIASRRGGLVEVVRDGETGCLVDDLNLDETATARAFAAAIGNVVFGPWEQRREMRDAARRDVIARFQVSPSVDAYEAVYRRVIAPVDAQTAVQPSRL